SGLVSMIIATQVPIIAVLSSLLLPGRSLTARSIAGAALGLLGVVVLFSGKGTGETNLLACAAVFVGAISWSFGTVLPPRPSCPSDAIVRAGMQMTCGGAMLALASVLRGEPAHVGLVTTRSLVALAYLIAFGSILAFGCYCWLLKHVRAEKVSTHVFINPLVAVALGAWLAGEQLRPAHLISRLLLLASVFVIIFRRGEGLGSVGLASRRIVDL